MYELTIRTHFDAAHSLRDYPGECARLHGHTFNVDVTVQGESLNKIGVVFDFKDLKRAVRDILDNLDHRHLNEVPPFDKLTPTAENLANHIFHELPRRLAGASGVAPVNVTRVDVWESPTARISYFEE